MEQIIQTLLEKAPEWGMKIVGAIITLIIGLWIIKRLNRALKSYFAKKDYDPSLESFLASLISILLKVALILTIASTLGIELTSFVAILGSAGLAIGMALSGTLSNFAGGVMILIFKPYKIGDVIEAQGYIGTVREIQIFNTILKTLDNKTIIIPNGKLATDSLVNYSTEELRKLVLTVGIGYGDNAEKAKQVLLDIVNQDPRVLKEPDAPFVALAELGDSSVNFTLRVWLKGSDYWAVKFDVNEKIYKTFGSHGLNIPFPQMDVHVHNA